MTGTPSCQRPINVEVMQLCLGPGPVLGYHVVRGCLPDATSPDDYALTLSGVRSGEPGGVCHSTSWRYENGVVVLTYAATPVRLFGALTPLIEPAIVCSMDPLRPAPGSLHAHHVAAHAVRHLAYLAEHDPAIAQASLRRPHLWSALRCAAAEMPVAPHALAHTMARSASSPQPA